MRVPFFDPITFKLNHHQAKSSEEFFGCLLPESLHCIIGQPTTY
jgi:hypothetical protein